MSWMIYLLVAVVAFIWSSFFEWFVHRYFMHMPRFPLRDAFRGHTLGHHQIYKSDETFQKQHSGFAKDVTLRWYAAPGMVVAHLPVLLVVHFVSGLPVTIPFLVGGLLYYAGYEYTHYLMHVPRGHFIERFAWFKFLHRHHLLHHRYMLRNLNVFVPLADLCFGTLVTAEGRFSKAERRRARRAWTLTPR